MTFIIRPTITETFLERVNTSGSQIAYLYKTSNTSEWKKITFSEFFVECQSIAYGLMKLGIGTTGTPASNSNDPNYKIALFSNTRYEWSLCDMAILGVRGITVPIYPSNTAQDIIYVLGQSDSTALFLENQKQLEKVLGEISENPQCLPLLRTIIIFDAPPNYQATAELAKTMGQIKLITLNDLKTLGQKEAAKNPGHFDKNLSSAKPNDLITICYTSGTTGIPKGAMITHDNMMSVLEDCVKVLGKYVNHEEETILSFLPFSHILGKVESMAIYTFGWREAFAESTDKLRTNLLEIRPTILFSAPRTFEKAYAQVLTTLERRPSSIQKTFHSAIKASKIHFEQQHSSKPVGLSLALPLAVPSLLKNQLYFFTKLFFAKNFIFNQIIAGFGGRLKFALCGGAPLPKEIAEFFEIVGIPIMEGYGLTETCAPVTINASKPRILRLGTVGRPLPEVSLKIAEDGEILIKSRKVFKGYYKMPEETDAVLKEGWFATGDIGRIDSDGYLYITDRKKDLIITSGGKNIAPQKIENLAKTYTLFQQFIVHGDRRPFLTALVTLNQEQTIQYAAENHILFSNYENLIKNSKILSLVQKTIDNLNRKLARFETIKRFAILPKDLSVEDGEITSSLKLRRKMIAEHYSEILDQMYP